MHASYKCQIYNSQYALYSCNGAEMIVDTSSVCVLRKLYYEKIYTLEKVKYDIEIIISVNFWGRVDQNNIQ